MAKYDLTDFVKWLQSQPYDSLAGRRFSSWESPLCYWLCWQHKQIGQIHAQTVNNILNYKTGKKIPEQGWMGPFSYLVDQYDKKNPQHYITVGQCLEIIFFLWPELKITTK